MTKLALINLAALLVAPLAAPTATPSEPSNSAILDRQPPRHHPNVLSPHTTGPLLEDVWPTLFFGEEAVAEILRKTKALPWAQAALAQMRHEAEQVIAQPPLLPVEKAGWRHDFYSRATAEHLQYDPASPGRFWDPLGGQFEQLPEQRRAWVLLTHERTYRLMRGVGVLYRVTGEERYARWVAQGMRAAYDYFTHAEFQREDLGGPALYYQNLYDAAVLAQLANAYSLTRRSPAFVAEDHQRIRRQIFEERMPSMIKFLRVQPTHNMSCFVSVALASAGALLDRPDWVGLAFGEQSGLRQQLLKGIPANERGQVDGFWYEGTTFYHFYSLCSLIGLWEADRARQGPLTADADLRRRFEAMFDAPISMVDRQLRLPLVGDLGAPRVLNLSSYRHLYEYAAGRLDPARFGPVLSAIYAASGLPRNGLAALAYGPDHLPPPGGIPASHTVLPVAGLGIFRSAGPEHLYVTFRCGKYVGGHDHPDRLAVALNAFGQLISPDLGEAGYSLRDRKTNLSYYRTTLAHNTIFADEAEQTGAATLEWQPEAVPPRARGIITQKGIRFQRSVIVDAPYVLLFDDYQAAEPHRYGWIFHAYGTLAVKPPDASAAMALELPPFPERLGFTSLRDRHTGMCAGLLLARWQVTPKVELFAAVASDGAFEFTSATAPGQPYPDTQAALVLRAPGANRRFATVLEPLSGTPATVARLTVEGNRVVLNRTDGSQRRYEWRD